MSPNLFSPAALSAPGRVPFVTGVRRVDAAGHGHGNGERPGTAPGDSRFADALRDATAQHESGPALVAAAVSDTAEGRPEGLRPQAAETAAVGLPPGGSATATANASGPVLAAGAVDTAAAPTDAQTDAATEVAATLARGDVPAAPAVLPGAARVAAAAQALAAALPTRDDVDVTGQAAEEILPDAARKALNAADRPSAAAAPDAAVALAGTAASLAAGRRDRLAPGGDASSKAPWSADPAQTDTLDERWPGRPPIKAPPGTYAANRATAAAGTSSPTAAGAAGTLGTGTATDTAEQDRSGRRAGDAGSAATPATSGSVPVVGTPVAADALAADGGGQGRRDAADSPLAQPTPSTPATASRPPAEAVQAGTHPPPALTPAADRTLRAAKAAEASAATPAAQPAGPSPAAGRPQGVGPDGLQAGAARDAQAAPEAPGRRATGAGQPAPAWSGATAAPGTLAIPATPDAATLARTAPAQRQAAAAAAAVASAAGTATSKAGTPLPVAGAETLSWAGAVAATAAPPAASAQAAPPVAELRLPLPPGQPGFAAAVGVQVSLMVRDGVQTARLHLHPAELGPITVQIALEGHAAQVHLAAEHALTRQALEQAMPTLAGSLRDSGLTLTGGGVFEQPRDGAAQSGAQAGSAGGSGSGRDPRGDDANGRTQAGAEDRPALTAALPRQRGVVDLVA